MIGTTLSHYKILAEIGRGGMGIVYKAEDTKLHRIVAIKVLPAAALASEDDRERFYREARAAAQLHHAHIATVFQIDEAIPVDESGAEVEASDGPRPFIAMEYIEGQTLKGHIEKAPLKLQEAVRIASEIGSALQAAHEKNIVHRDIKSANVMLTEKGEAKVLDFGLAKTAHSTMLTRMGSTLGTVAYMSPEQARGEEVDHRTDLWSLGVILYEMITGRVPAPGDYEQAVVYSILNEAPEPLTGLRSGVPMQLEWMVNKCLAKDPDERYQSAKGLLVDLKSLDLKGSGTTKISSAVTGSRHSVVQEPVATQAPVPKSSGLPWKTVAVGVVLVAATALASWAFWGSQSTEPESTVQRFKLGFEGVTQISRAGISPDGKFMFLVGLDTLGQFGLHIYSTSSGQLKFVENSGNIRNPRFSPDGTRLAFQRAGAGIHYLLLPSGAPLQVAEIGAVPAWFSNDELMYAKRDAIMRISISQGDESVLFEPDSTLGQVGLWFPQHIPGQNTVLMDVENEDGTLSVAVGDATDGTMSILRSGACCARYVSGGHILYHVGEPSGQVVAAPFDAKSARIVGAPVDILPATIWWQVYVSQDGTLVHGSTTAMPMERLVWLDEDGTETDLEFEDVDIVDLSLSPDGSTAALRVRGEELSGTDIVLTDMTTGTMNPLTFNGNSMDPTWSPDGQYVYYSGTGRVDGQGIYRKRVDLSAPEELVRPDASSPELSLDGRWLAFEDGRGDGDLSVLDLSNGTYAVLDSAETDQDDPVISPDGRFVAYESQHTGRQEVYVRSIEGEGFWSVSSGVANEPAWSPDGNYIYFRSSLSTLWRVRVTTSPIFQRLSSPEQIRGPAGWLSFSVDPTSGRILLGTRGGQTEDAQIDLLNMVLNFPEELARVAPPNQ